MDFIYVGDVADAFVLAIDEHAKNNIFNVGSGSAISMNELARLVNDITGNESQPYYNPNHPMFMKHVQADINKIKSMLGWTPIVSMEEGLRNTVDFFKRCK